MAAPVINLMPPAPSPVDSSDVFDAKAFEFTLAMDPFATQANELAVWVGNQATAAAQSSDSAEVFRDEAATLRGETEALRDETEALKDSAASLINFVGVWSELSGPLNMPAVVYHDSAYWGLLSNLADVTASEPSAENSDWLKALELSPADNLTATENPAAGNDETQGYGPTSRWINISTGELWLCISAAAGAADWKLATLTVDDLGSAALADVGTGDDQLPRNQDLGSAALADVGTGADQLPRNQDLGPGLFRKSWPSGPAWTIPVAGAMQTAAAITADVGGELTMVSAADPVATPPLSPGTDYYIYLASDGSLQAVDADSASPAGERLVGGFHCRDGDGEINPNSLWDLNWRPAAPSPRGMTLDTKRMEWVDIYLMHTDYGIDGYSRAGKQIADDSSPPKIPLAYGGDGALTYGSLTWYEAVDLASAAGKRLLSYDDFTSAAYGVVERQSVGTDPVTTQHQAGHRSAIGCEQITGTLWQWGSNINGTSATGTVAWQDIAAGRGSVYTHSISAVVLGARWNDGADAGSRASNWYNAPSDSHNSISARAACDHLNLQPAA